MKYITLKQIKQLHPCRNQYRAASRLFGKRKRMAVSVRLAESLATRFDFYWLARKLLSASAWADYNRAIAPAFARAYLTQK